MTDLFSIHGRACSHSPHVAVELESPNGSTKRLEADGYDADGVNQFIKEIKTESRVKSVYSPYIIPL